MNERTSEQSKDGLHGQIQMRLHEQIPGQPPPGAELAEPVGVLEILASLTWHGQPARLNAADDSAQRAVRKGKAITA